MQELLPGEASEPAEGQEADALPGLRLTPSRLGLPLSLALAAAAGFLTSIAFPPAEIWPLGFVSLVPFLWVVRGGGAGRRALAGLVFGIAFFGPTVYWILLFGELAFVALVLMLASFTTVFAWLAGALIRRGSPVWTVVGLSSLWTAIEWLRGLIPFGGFTWGTLGIAQVDNRVTLRLASVAGVWGVSFVVVAVNALLVEAIAGGGGGRRRIGHLGLAAAIGLAPAAIAFPSADGTAVDVAAIQVDVRTARGADPTEEDVAVARLNIDAHMTLAGDPPDLTVWGESALDPGATTPEVFSRVQAAIGAVGAPTLAGSIQPGGVGLQNQVLALDGTGAVVDRYAKTHLVPFGEYVPLRGALTWLDALQQIPYDLSPGEEVHTLSIPGLPPIATPVCFENSFPAIDRSLVNDGAGFFVVLTNNASYDLTAASRQHVQMSRMRAVEDGRWVVHAAVSGISAFVDPSGRIVAQAGLFEPATLRHTIRSSQNRTPYVRFGDWLPWLSIVAAGGLSLRPRRRGVVRPGPDRLPEGSRTLVILPTYEERDTIGEVLARLLALEDHVDLLVIDDSSPDGTGAIVREAAATEPRIRLSERPTKAGLASAYLEGFATAIRDGYDLIVEMDSDLSHRPEELPGLLEAARAHDLTIGSRYVDGGSVTNWSRSRVALSRVGNRYARLMLGFPVHDATSGFRVYRRALLQHLTAQPITSEGYGFQIELVDRSWSSGYDVGESPVSFREREHGRSKISRRIVAEALWLVTRWGFRARLRAPIASHAQRP